MTGYTRKDTTNNIADGNIINAADLDNEFDGVQAAFHASTGHTHDGTAAEGAAITKVGPVQDVLITTAAIYPKTTNTVDLGTSSLKYKDAFIAGNETVGGTLAVTGVTTLTAQPVLSSLTASQAVFTNGTKGLVSNAITGTGDVVMSASPTLTGTANVAGLTASEQIASTQTGSATTGAGQLYLNGATSNRIDFNSNGATTPSFTTRSDGTKITLFPALSGSQVDYAIGISAATQWYSVPVNSNSFFFKWFGGETQIASLDGTGVLTLAGNPVLSGGTANGVAYLNGTKVLTTGSALTFDGTTFAVSSSDSRFNVTSTGNSQTAGISIKGGPIAGSDYNFIESLNSSGTQQWYLGGNGTANVLAFKVATAEQMRLTSTGLGIGTSSPGAKLHVLTADGATTSITAGATGKLRVFGYADATRGALLDSINTAENTYLPLTINGSSLLLQTGATTRATLDSSGNLGLGVTPSAWGSSWKAFEGQGGFLGSAGTSFLTLGQNSYNNGTSSIYKTSNYASQYIQVSSEHRWYTAPSGTAGAAISFTQAMTLDASGNLGVGATSVSAQLHIQNANGNSGAGTDNTGMALVESTYAANASQANASFIAKNYYGYGQFMQWQNFGMRIGSRATANNGAGAVVFTYGNDSAGMTLDGSGNLGLGVTPSAWGSLFKAQQIGATGAVWGSTSTAGTWLSRNTYFNGSSFVYLATATANAYELDSAGAHKFYLAPSGTAGAAVSFTQAMTLDASGNLLVGTTTDEGERTRFESTSAAQLSLVYTGIGKFSFKVDSGRNLSILDGTTERARIDSSGNLLVGTTTNYTSSKLLIAGDSYTSSSTTNQGTTGWAGVAQYGIGSINISRNGSNVLAFYHTTNASGLNGTAVGTVSITTSATAYNTGSDYRLKNITGPITTSGAYIDSLKPVEGTWKVDGSTFVGLIAHETQEVSRTTVATGTKDGEQMQGMDYSSAEIIANLIAEIQSLRKRLTALEAK